MFARYYKSFDDMILLDWIECHNGNYIHVRKGKRGTPEMDIKRWEEIQNAYILEFGLQDEFFELMDLQIEKAIQELEYIISNDRKKLNKVNALDAKLRNKLANKGENLDIEDVLIYLSKYYGYKLTKENTKVREYFKMINIYTKAHATANKEE